MHLHKKLRLQIVIIEKAVIIEEDIARAVHCCPSSAGESVPYSAGENIPYPARKKSAKLFNPSERIFLVMSHFVWRQLGSAYSCFCQ